MNLTGITWFLVIFLKLLSSGCPKYIKLTGNEGNILHESNISSSSECQNRPTEWTTDISGIQSGYQLVLYSEPDCMSSHLRYTKPGIIMSLKFQNDSVNRNQLFQVRSWQAYVPRLSTNKFKVEIYNALNKQKSLKTFEDVCGCTKIEHQKDIELDTYYAMGKKCLKLYTDSYCFSKNVTSNSLHLDTPYPFYVYDPNYPEVLRVRSFQHCIYSEHCILLQGSFRRFTQSPGFLEKNISLYKSVHIKRIVNNSEAIPYFFNESRSSNVKLDFSKDDTFLDTLTTLNLTKRKFSVPFQYRNKFLGSQIQLFEQSKFNDIYFGLKIFKGEVIILRCDQDLNWCIDKTISIKRNEPVSFEFFYSCTETHAVHYDVEITVTGIYANKDELSASDIKAYINMNYQLNLTDTYIDNGTVLVKHKFRSESKFCFASVYNISQINKAF